MTYLNKIKPLNFGLLVLVLFFGWSCSTTEDLITQPPNFNAGEYLKPNEYGIKNSTEFLKKSDEIIENSEFIPARVEGGLKELIGNVKFPYESQDQFQEGEVYLNLFIDENGEVVFVRVLESPDDRLTRYSIYAVQNTGFLPATLNHSPVKSTRLVMFNFNFAIDNDVTY